MLKSSSRRWEPKTVIRAVLGSLLALNLAALALVVWPPGGSAEELERQMLDLRTQVRARQQQIERQRLVASKVEKGRGDADKFFDQYFLDTRTAFLTIVSELQQAAKNAQIAAREHSFNSEPIEGSDNLSMMTITGNYEGTYADLMHFVNTLDRSSRFVILESLNAAPQQGSPRLSVMMKLNAFVRDEAPAP